MQYTNKDNSQFNQPNVHSTAQASFRKQSGGKPYGVTMDSLADSTIIGKSRPFVSKHYSNCSAQEGGSKAFLDSSSYGFTKEGASLANDVRGSYAPISPNMQKNQCGGRKRKSRRKRKSKRKRKSRNKRRQSKTRKRKQRGGCACAGGMVGGKRKRRSRKRRSRKRRSRKRRSRKRRSRKRRSRKQRGGRYQQYGSNVPSSAGYSMPNPGSSPWATGPGSYSRYQNC